LGFSFNAWRCLSLLAGCTALSGFQVAFDPGQINISSSKIRAKGRSAAISPDNLAPQDLIRLMADRTARMFQDNKVRHWCLMIQSAVLTILVPSNRALIA
jgi:hypothetical protein